MFYVPKTQKSYSLAAVLRWSEWLFCEENSDWERKLVPAEFLKTGRELYRKIPHAYSLNLELRTATLVFRLENIGDIKIILSVDTETSRLKWHCPEAAIEFSLQAGLAVAAVYFVEEFIAEEIPRTAAVFEEEKTVPAAGKNKGGNGGAPAVPEEKKPSDGLFLRLTFVLRETFLELRADFVFENDPSKTVNALARPGEIGLELCGENRAKLAKLGLFAHRNNFVFNSNARVYELAGLDRAESFFRENLKVWKQAFPQISGVDAIAGIFNKTPIAADVVAKISSVRGNAFSVRRLFSIRGKFLSEKQVDSLIRARGGNVYFQGFGLVKLRPRDIEFIEEWEEREGAPLPLYSLLSLFQDRPAANVIADKKLSAWKKRFLKEPKIPAGTPEFLRPYQHRGVAWIRKMLDCGVHPLIADEMGLGKTLQTLSAVSLDKNKNVSLLILCPASVVPVWENEIRKFFPQMPTGVFGTLRGGVPAKTGVTLTSYGYFRNNKRLFCRRRYTYAVLDEAQFIKNPDTKIARAVMEIRAKHRIALTGTPVENRHIDLWTIFRFLMPGLLGKRTELETSLETDENFAGRLRAQIAPFILRRTKEEVAKDLPEKSLNVLYCPMNDSQREVYETLARRGIEEYKNTNVSEIFKQKPLNFLTLLLRLRQAACDASLPAEGKNLPAGESSGKLTALAERVEEIVANGGRIVIFSQFVKFLERAGAYLRERFPNLPFFTITGATIDRATPVREFQNAEGPAIFLISLRAGGTGLTLTRAEYVFLLDPWWNPAVEEQAIDRVHRIGQTKCVFVYRMITAGTIEERIEKLKQSKRELFNSVIEDKIDISQWSQFYPTLESLFALKDA